MSLLFMSIASAILVTIEEAVERRQERVKWARRRARQYTFN